MNASKSPTNIEYFEQLFGKNNYNFGACTEELKKRYANVTSQSFAGVKGGKTKDGGSTQIRNLGNASYQAKRFTEAHKFYTQSIGSAEPNTLELAQAYSNRAKVLFVKKYYKECLEDIKRAVAITVYPEESKMCLLDLKNKALKKFQQQKTIQYHLPAPPINNPSGENPAVADCLIGQENKEWGRHVVASRDIEPGEVLLVEEPYVQAVNHEMVWSYCTECLELCFNLIMCDTCYAIMFCSEACKEKAYASYHKYECILTQEDVTIPSHYIFLRMTLKCITEKANSDSNSFSDEYERIWKIKTDKTNQKSLKYKQMISDICDHLISKSDIVKLMKLEKKEAEIFLKAVMYNNFLVCSTNIFRLLNYEPKALSFRNIGTGFYEFFSKFNHSCIGNVSYSFFGKKLVMRAIRKIKKGEQCFVNYERINPYKLEKRFRQDVLENDFNFTCKCKACEEDWPLGVTLKSVKTEDPNIKELSAKALLGIKLIMDSEKGEKKTLGEILGGGDNFDVRDSTGEVHPAMRQILLEDAFEVAEKLIDFQPCQEFYFVDHVFDKLLLRGNFEVKF